MGGRNPAIVQDYRDQPIVTDGSQKLDLDTIKKTISLAAVSQNWDVKLTDAPAGHGKLILTRTIRNKHTMAVSVTFDTSRYSIEYKTSVNLNAATCEGKVYIHPNYNRWVGDLNSSIRGKLRTI